MFCIGFCISCIKLSEEEEENIFFCYTQNCWKLHNFALVLEVRTKKWMGTNNYDNPVVLMVTNWSIIVSCWVFGGIFSINKFKCLKVWFQTSPVLINVEMESNNILKFFSDYKRKDHDNNRCSYNIFVDLVHKMLAEGRQKIFQWKRNWQFWTWI